MRMEAGDAWEEHGLIFTNQLSFYRESTCLKVNVFPTETEHFTLAQASEQNPLEEDQVAVFLREVQGHPHEYLYKIALGERSSIRF